jgi:hypothetical protein
MQQSLGGRLCGADQLCSAQVGGAVHVGNHSFHRPVTAAAATALLLNIAAS